MKIVDRVVGIPACFVLSILRYGIDTFGPKRSLPSDRPVRMLFIELSEMGSMVAACPAMQAAAERYPRTELFFLTLEQNRACIDMLHIIPPENVVTFSNRSPGPFLSTLLAALRTLRRRRIDISVDFELFSRISGLLSYLSGAHLRVGFDRYSMEGLYRGRLLTHPVQYNHYTHISRNFMALIRSLSADSRERPLLKERIEPDDLQPPRSTADPEVKTMVWNRLLSIQPSLKDKQFLYLINPNAGDLLPIRAWPLERYIELTRRLLEDDGAYAVIIGTPEASNDARAMKAALPDERVVDFTGQTAFEELIPLFELGDMLITNDSGPAHFASLTSIPIAVFYGPETPDLYRPLSDRCEIFYAGYQCSPCLNAYNHRTTLCTHSRCLTHFSVDEVYNRVKRLARG